MSLAALKAYEALGDCGAPETFLFRRVNELVPKFRPNRTRSKPDIEEPREFFDALRAAVPNVPLASLLIAARSKVSSLLYCTYAVVLSDTMPDSDVERIFIDIVNGTWRPLWVERWEELKPRSTSSRGIAVYFEIFCRHLSKVIDLTRAVLYKEQIKHVFNIRVFKRFGWSPESVRCKIMDPNSSLADMVDDARVFLADVRRMFRDAPLSAVLLQAYTNMPPKLYSSFAVFLRENASDEEADVAQFFAEYRARLDDVVPLTLVIEYEWHMKKLLLDRLYFAFGRSPGDSLEMTRSSRISLSAMGAKLGSLVLPTDKLNPSHSTTTGEYSHLKQDGKESGDVEGVDGQDDAAPASKRSRTSDSSSRRLSDSEFLMGIKEVFQNVSTADSKPVLTAALEWVQDAYNDNEEYQIDVATRLTEDQALRVMAVSESKRKRVLEFFIQ
ncbi:hypothetical protein H9P43_006885 [Blastocladiella emersonii ATCC 22665]|nr:hypothetical protein H9P43_006885 [Blastocladiella emersonii ATCC 22665]